MTLIWTDINVKRECVDEYPFAKFFSPVFRVHDQIVDAINDINEWINDNPSENGLIIGGLSQSGKTHVGLMLSVALGYPLIDSSELFRWALNKEQGSYQNVVNRFTKNRIIIDNIGDESPTGDFPDPMAEIIDQLWMKGIGIIGTTRKKRVYLSGLYGEAKVNAMSQSCKWIKLSKENQE